MKYSEIFEDAAVDLASSRQAQVLVNAFMRWIMDKTENETLSDWGLMRIGQSEKGKFYYVSATMIGMKGYPDLNFGFERSNARGGYLSRIQYGDTIRCYAVVKVPFDALNVTDVAYKMSTAQWSTLVHEVTHYLDIKRIGKESETIQGVKNTGPSTAQKYYNDPLEKNAFFQQGLANIITRLARAARSRKDVPSFVTDFNVFKKQFSDEFTHGDHRYLDQLSPENRRKFDKRLYKIFDLVSKKWPNIPEVQVTNADNEEAVARWKASGKD